MPPRSVAGQANGVLTADEVHCIAFSRPFGRGYDVDQVDAFLDRVEAALRIPAQSVRTAEFGNAQFSAASWDRRGYDEAEVDAFVDRVSDHFGVDVPRSVAKPRRRTWPRRLLSGVIAVVVIGFSLVCLALAGRDYHAYRTGAPTSAAVESCKDMRYQADGQQRGGLDLVLPFLESCAVTWTGDGQEHRGEVEVLAYEFRLQPRSIDVRVHDGSAYTVARAINDLEMGVAVLGVGAVVVLFVWTGRRLGRLIVDFILD